MEISSTTTEDLNKHLQEIQAETAHRRTTGNPGAGNGYLAAMNDDGLRDHQMYVMRELWRRDTAARNAALFNGNK